MNDEQFVSEVKNLARLDSEEEARSAMGGTLETLKERLGGEEPSNLAAQLPPEIAPHIGGRAGVLPRGRVLRAGGAEGGRRKRPGGRTRKGCGHGLADGRHGGELDDVRSQLGDPYKELFGQAGAST